MNTSAPDDSLRHSMAVVSDPFRLWQDSSANIELTFVCRHVKLLDEVSGIEMGLPSGSRQYRIRFD